MPPRSNVDKLTPELRAKFHQLVDDPTLTRAQIAAAMNAEAGEQIISTSGVNRYMVRHIEMLERKRRADELADMWERRTSQTGNRLGRVLNEQMRVMLVDFLDVVDTMRTEEGGEDENPQKDAIDSMLKVARTLKALEESDHLNAEREAEIRNQALEEAASAVEKKATSAGMSAKTAEEFRRAVLGLKNG